MNKACTRNVGKRSCLTKDEAQNVFTVRPVHLLSTQLMSATSIIFMSNLIDQFLFGVFFFYFFCMTTLLQLGVSAVKIEIVLNRDVV